MIEAKRLRKNKIGMVSLGCPKNLVDSEIMLGTLEHAGFRIVDSAEDADVLIINTCAFTEEAKKESLNVIFQALELKRAGTIKALVVTGCLPQRYKEQLSGDIDGVDAYVGTGEESGIQEIINEVLAGRSVYRIGPAGYPNEKHPYRHSLIPAHFAYVKIAEGCRNRCSYCVVPDLRGDYRSRSREDITAETERLARQGVKEINLIAQDTTFYGMENGAPLITELLKKLVKIKDIGWFRLLYAHPAHFTDELIEFIKEEPRVCNYIDLPVQHINDSLLKAMRRKVSRSGILSLIKKLRKRIPGVALRTSVIVGFPGEGEAEFKELMDFVNEMKFEHLGAFMYSREEGTPACAFPGQVSSKIKRERYDEVMRLQQEICLEKNRTFLGKEVDVLIDEKLGEGDATTFLARRECDAPEVDGAVFLESDQPRVGDFARVKITDTLEYDLVGEMVNEPSQ